ncbi:pentapeptide repeat-containing protein [Amycolatopsis rhabdoformis]|uniref:Pentapeptide repeat-containing protein n=1 Tax=Amycolatopsis rhabdoformis TaxID=1448059 RepID=A0ABZ1HWQ6_9PSEU|nr:pentapeptide repeat-containing protein [Amycolatopsis rhabdoformis]WSE26046.1 pentapeptide repeat-containing protein [Amycolatopsis rhabdoformis]
MGETRSGGRHREFAWLWVWLALVLSIAVGTGVAVLLWGATRAEHRDAFDTGWKSAAAVLAILAAVVTVERLRLGQREHHRQLAADRAKQDADRAAQITDLSAKAGEQLGSDKAAVRIGGLTDLERLAQSYPDLRQTVVDRICAYLRAPYRLPTGDEVARSDGGAADAEIAARRLELDVRRTAQQVLKRHLRWEDKAEGAPASFWDGVTLDLRDAVLHEFDLGGARLASADFRNARFSGPTSFERVSLTHEALFTGAVFAGRTTFDNAAFADEAWFDQVSFAEYTWFGSASFEATALFRHTTFGEEAVFSGASFADTCSFAGVEFGGAAVFARASFAQDSSFKGASFAKSPVFDRASFRALVTFSEATVTDAEDPPEWPTGRAEPQVPVVAESAVLPEN